VLSVVSIMGFVVENHIKEGREDFQYIGTIILSCLFVLYHMSRMSESIGLLVLFVLY
jgi:hypothetical protein